MPDILIHHIDEAMVERIKTLARERDSTLNDIILHALRFGLDMGGHALRDGHTDVQDVARLAGTWDPEESRAFDDAVSSLNEAPDGQFAVRSNSGRGG